jgi:hypothetical protein
LKFAPLLAQFLYTHKRLDLPGIGSFLLDPSTVVDNENSKQAKPVLLEGVTFENNSSIQQSADLVAFIASQTGKIKALASADLESHLELAKQFLNIGKPFLFEGIGSLAKMQAGGFSFTPGLSITDKIKDTSAKEPANTISTEEPVSDYRSIFYSKKTPTNWKKPVVILLLLVGIIGAIWGGYAVYKKTMAKKRNKAEEVKKEELAKTPDTPSATVKDTTALTSPAVPQAPVAVTAEKVRALKRFARLSTLGVKNVQMETKDSVSFKLYFIIPAAVADTAHILDSLRRNYTPTGSKAYVEN